MTQPAALEQRAAYERRTVKSAARRRQATGAQRGVLLNRRCRRAMSSGNGWWLSTGTWWSVNCPWVIVLATFFRRRRFFRRKSFPQQAVLLAGCSLVRAFRRRRSLCGQASLGDILATMASLADSAGSSPSDRMPHCTQFLGVFCSVAKTQRILGRVFRIIFTTYFYSSCRRRIRHAAVPRTSSPHRSSVPGPNRSAVFVGGDEGLILRVGCTSAGS